MYIFTLKWWHRCRHVPGYHSTGVHRKTAKPQKCVKEQTPADCVFDRLDHHLSVCTQGWESFQASLCDNGCMYIHTHLQRGRDGGADVIWCVQKFWRKFTVYGYVRWNGRARSSDLRFYHFFFFESLFHSWRPFFRRLPTANYPKKKQKKNRKNLSCVPQGSGVSVCLYLCAFLPQAILPFFVIYDLEMAAHAKALVRKVVMGSFVSRGYVMRVWGG